MTLRKWLLYILINYKKDYNYLYSFNLDEYIKYSLEKLRQTEDIKILNPEDIINNPNCLLYSQIQTIPSYASIINTPRLKKGKHGFIIDEKGEYYLSATGICFQGRQIELINEKGIEYTLQHELQHINQNYSYPSEFPFTKDMIKMLNEGEGEYHKYLINESFYFFNLTPNNQYYVYYIIYTLLMFVIPPEMQDSWRKLTSNHINSCTLSDIFKSITFPETKKEFFSEIFSIITLIIAQCNPENTQEIFANSINASLERCSKRVNYYNKIIQQELSTNKAYNLEQQREISEAIQEKTTILQNPDLFEKEYLQAVADEKDIILKSPKEEQEQLYQMLKLFTPETL